VSDGRGADRRRGDAGGVPAGCPSGQSRHSLAEGRLFEQLDPQEKGITHLDDIKQFRNNGGHPSEKRRPAASFHLVPITLDLYECALLLGDFLTDSCGVHVLHRGQKYSRRHAWCMRGVRWPVLERRKKGEILRKSTRVCCKVFVRRKLRWVDKDRYHGQVILGE